MRTYDVQPHLGRHLVLDPRTLDYRRPYVGQTLHTADWEPALPVLDQTNLLTQGVRTSLLFHGVDDVDVLGACNAGTAALAAILTAEEAKAAGLDTTDPVAAEEFAIELYAAATTCDQWHDLTWPSQDCGSSSLGVAQALKARGLIDQYGTGTTAAELCALLQTGPVAMGMPWHDAFTNATEHALLDDLTGWEDTPVMGGHAVCVTALEQIGRDETGSLVPARTIVRVRNSWGTTFGDHGSFRMSLDVYQRLRREIDLIQFRRNPR
ncbi:hypothetical protein OG937_10730 [Streptomyces sp. NBC_00510]